MRHIISALVQNQPGVLAHISGMFAGRGFNIDSLVVGRTETPEFSRMTIVVVGDETVLEQVRKQLGKIITVVKINDYSEKSVVERDLMLLRVSTTPAQRLEVIKLVEVFRGTVVDIGNKTLIVQLTGPEEKVEAFIELVRPYGIKELARTGVIAMPRDDQSAAVKRRGESVAAALKIATVGAPAVDDSKLPPS